MKRYRLIKDLPFAKAGEIFESKIDMTRASIIYAKKGVPVKAGSADNFAELERLAEKMKDYILREKN